MIKKSSLRYVAIAVGCGVTFAALTGCSRAVEAPPQQTSDAPSASGESAAGGEVIEITPDLVAAAEKEGEVTVQYPNALEAMTGLVASFNKEYPNIKVNLERKAGAPGGASMLQEYQAGVARVDVFGGSDVPTALEVAKAGGIKDYVSVDHDLYPEEFLIAPGLYATTATTIVTGFNRNVVSTEQAKTLSDWPGITDPQWKDKIAVTSLTTSSGSFALYYGWKNLGESWLQGLADNSPKIYDGTAGGRDAIVSGQAGIAFGQIESSMIGLVADGAPVGFAYPDPTAAFQSNFFGVVSNAPHPNAAKLFWAWITSKAGCTAEQQAPIFQRCPMTDIEDIPDLPTDAEWFQPMKEMWLPTPDDWDQGLKDLAVATDKVLGTH